MSYKCVKQILFIDCDTKEQFMVIYLVFIQIILLRKWIFFSMLQYYTV